MILNLLYVYNIKFPYIVKQNHSVDFKIFTTPSLFGDSFDVLLGSAVRTVRKQRVPDLVAG